MRKRFCDHEVRVLEAATSGVWKPALRRHLDECPACAEVALVAAAMNEVEADLADARVPDAEFVWWKAQIKARRAAAERATQPIAVAEKVACAGGGLALVAVLAFLWPAVQTWAASAAKSWVQESQAAPEVAIGLVSICAVGLVSVLFAVGIGVYFAWSDR